MATITVHPAATAGLKALAEDPKFVAYKADVAGKWGQGKAVRATLMAANGLRAAREAKGYGRAAIAVALGITTAQWATLEIDMPGGTAQVAAVRKAIEGLPSVKRTKETTKVADKPAPKGKATPKVTGKPAATDLL